MLYKFLKILTSIFFRVYYTLETKGIKNIPHRKSIIFSPNHTNAFVDPVILAMNIKPRVRFYARGDVFKGKFLNWLLNELSMSPIYRARDGFTDSRRNDKTFQECKQRLANDEALMIFPEGICVQEKRLQPLKRGLAQIVYQTEEAFDFKKDVLVYPVGLNYSDAKKFRSKAFINIGEPISLKKQEHILGQRKSHNADVFTALLQDEMKKLIVCIDDKNNDELVEGINEIYLPHLLKHSKHRTTGLEKEFAVRREIADTINLYAPKHPEQTETLKQKVKNYLQQLNKHKLRDHLLRPESINASSVLTFLLEFIVIWVGMPIYGLGLLTNYLPYYISKRITENKVQLNEFKASVYASAGMFLWIAFYGIQLLIVALAFKNWSILGVYALAVPLLGIYVLHYYPLMKKIFGRWRLLRLVRNERKAVEQLMFERAEIIENLDLAWNEYLQSKNV